MTSRANDWLAQAERDLEQARSSQGEGRHEWACFDAQQSAEKAVEALHLHLCREAWGRVVARLLRELPIAVDDTLVDKGKVLDNFYIPTRYANGHPEGRPSSTTAPSRATRQSAMPVRSLHSSVLRWPERETVLAAARGWAADQARRHPEVVAVGCYGSYARGDWGVGSDLDVVAIVQGCNEPFERRALSWDLDELPVPADILIYTRDEWERIQSEGSRFGRMLRDETIWLWVRDGAEGFRRAPGEANTRTPRPWLRCGG